MYTIQLIKPIHMYINIFYRFGFWQRDEESNYRKNGKRFSLVFFYGLFPAFLIADAFLLDDLSESLRVMMMFFVCAIIYIKCLYLIFKQEKIFEYLNDLSHLLSPNNREEYDQTNKKLNFFSNIFAPYCYVAAITATCGITVQLPIFSEDHHLLPFFISISWNDSDIIYYSLFVFISLLLMLCVISIMITPLLWYIMFSYSIAFDLLGNQFKNLGRKEMEIKDHIRQIEGPHRGAFVDKFIVMIKFHRNLTETVERFKSTFNTLFMGQITMSGLLICLSVYNLSIISTDNMFVIQSNVVVLTYAVADIFMIMHFGNEITDSSSRLGYRLFESNWIEQTETDKKYVLIMCEILKQPLEIVILIYPLNLETFTSYFQK
ncbi:odorant receptor 94a-like isoform X2 [Bradysia coprophila]|uniref:odorant receptor 94a-like isoform X2 n=1 Tax=Bradysia coprophila TaxID=38358 RepID=UPI00187DA8C9|nr:odorant receptor 94a-like isoform X2 [Bradysia coprophila]